MSLKRIPKSSYNLPTMEQFEDIKKNLSQQKKKAYTPEQALDVVTQNALHLFEKVSKKFRSIDFERSKSLVIELRKRITRLARDRPASTIVGTAIYLENREFTPSDANKIM